jgi:hypothetical protein
MRRVAYLGALVLLPLVASNCSSEAISDKASGGGGAGGASGSSGAAGTTTAGTGTQGMPPLRLSCGRLLGSSECDPVSGWPCHTISGESCDYKEGAFMCVPRPEPAAFCDQCDPEVSTCGAGMSCDFDYHLCVHYCCVDRDCPKGSACAHQNAFGVGELAEMGFCQQERVASCGDTPVVGTAGGSTGGGPGDTPSNGGAGGEGGN